MPFYVYCMRCNADGSYKAVDRDCSKCSATGNDWREDNETSYLERYGVTLEELKEKREVHSKKGITVFYMDDFPPIEEERSRVTYREEEKELKSWEKEDVVKVENFKERLRFFTDNFYHDTVLNMNAELSKLSNISGEFDKVSLGLSISGLQAEMLEKSKKSLEKIEQDTAGQGDAIIEELVKKYPDFIHFIFLQEAISHETFHFIQFMTCKSMNALYQYSKRLMSLRLSLLSECVRQDVKFIYGEGNIFDGILRLPTQEDQEYFFDVIENMRLETLGLSNFFHHKGRVSGLTLLDICEGSAFAFQKLVIRSQNVETFKPKGRYSNAWNYYQKKGGKELPIFFLTAYLSLKYGILDDGDCMQGAVPAPPELFEMLCENITEYESSNWIFFSKDMILDIIVQIMQRIRSDIFEYVEKKDYPSMDSFEDVDSFQTESRAFYSGYDTVYDSIQEEYPSVHSYKFIAQLLSDFVVSSKFIHFVSRSIPTVKFKDIFGQPSDIKTETRMFKIVDDFDTFVRGERIFCCKKHGYTYKYGIITSCDEEDSFNKAFYMSSDRTLKSVVAYPQESI